MNKSDVKINEAERNIISLEVVDWSRLISPDHVAYRLMNVLEQFDLEDLYLSIKSKKKSKVVQQSILRFYFPFCFTHQ